MIKIFLVIVFTEEIGKNATRQSLKWTIAG